MSRRSFTIDFKRKVLASLATNSGNISATARQYNLDRSHIQRCNKQSDDLLGISDGKRKREEGPDNEDDASSDNGRGNPPNVHPSTPGI